MATLDLARRPDRSEYADFYAGYVAAVPDGDLLATLEREGRVTVAALAALPAERADFAYAPGKWTIREVVAHVSDAERVFSYRALRFGRNDPTPLPSFDQEHWTPYSHAATREWRALLDELATVRAASLHLFRSFEAEDWDRRGIASGVPVTVRALAWIVAGHQLHHRRVLVERYGLRT
jgi:uncharacterized damage-inducible protein DinB